MLPLLLRRAITVCFSLCLLAASDAQAQGSFRIATGLSNPTFLTVAPGDAERLFITQITGEVLILDITTRSVNAVPFVDVSDASQEGLQGLAFHPDYETNGFFYVFFHNASYSWVRRYTVTANPDLADHPVEQYCRDAKTHNHAPIIGVTRV